MRTRDFSFKLFCLCVFLDHVILPAIVGQIFGILRMKVAIRLQKIEKDGAVIGCYYSLVRLP